MEKIAFMETMVQLPGVPLWLQYLLQGIGVFAMLASSAIVLTRAGRNPYLALLMALPYVQIVALWVFAFTKWPKKK